jgi:hypothetical protein
MLNSQSDVFVKKADIGLGPAMASRVIFFEHLNLHLRDATYPDLTNVEITDIVKKSTLIFRNV